MPTYLPTYPIPTSRPPEHQQIKLQWPKFGLIDSKPVSTPVDCSSKLTKREEIDKPADQTIYQAAVGCLLYISTKTRPDISFAVGNSEMASLKLTSMEIHEDNQSAIEIAKNPKCHGRTKHIDIRHHFVRDLVGQGSIY